MTKNIYRSCYYYHEYYCDNCFCKIKNGDIYRQGGAIDNNIFDLCENCYNKFYNKAKEALNDTEK